MSATTAPAWPPRGVTPLGSWPPHAPVDPFWPALLLALILHGLLIYALGFQAPEPSRAPGRTLEVLVLRQPEAVRPPRPDAEALAQGSQEASGTASEIAAMDRRPSERRAEPIDSPATAIESEQAPPPVMLESGTPEPPPLPEAIPAPPADAVPLMATLPEPMPIAPAPAPNLARPAEPDQQPAPQPTSAPPPPPSVADILASRGQEIAKLNAKIEEDTAAYANRPRRKAISASTQEYKYASYLEAWRRKVESIGNLNYPEEAKRRQLYGNLILRVALRADGTLEEVRVLRSSGSEVLDQAAVRIVNLAAPYAPFPPDIRKETDVLDITRTWQFLSNNRFGEKQ